MNIVNFVRGCDYSDGCDRFIAKQLFGQTPVSYLILERLSSWCATSVVTSSDSSNGWDKNLYGGKTNHLV